MCEYFYYDLSRKWASACGWQINKYKEMQKLRDNISNFAIRDLRIQSYVYTKFRANRRGPHTDICNILVWTSDRMSDIVNINPLIN